MCPLELTATPDTSPRYIPAGSFSALGAESNGISGAWAKAASGANIKNARTSANFFIQTSSFLQSWALLDAENVQASVEPDRLSMILQGCELPENTSVCPKNANGKAFRSCSARLQAGTCARLQSANLKVGATIDRQNSRIEVTFMPQDYLLKTEPSEYSFADLLKDKTNEWDGVSNPVAVKNLREMTPGARLIIYETGSRKSAVGTATVVSVQASDPKKPKVKIKAGKSLANPVSLAAIKANKLFKDSALVRIGRLSVVPLTAEQYGVLSGD